MPNFISAAGSPSRQDLAKYGGRMSLWGDSRVTTNWSTSGTYPAAFGTGQFWLLEAMTHGALRLDYAYNFGVSGDRISQLLYRMVNDIPNAAGVKPSKVPPSFAFILIGTNSIGEASSEGYTSSQLHAQLLEVVEWLRKHGHIVFLTAEWPRGDSVSNTLSAANLPFMLRYRDYCLSLGALEGVYVADVFARSCDPGRTDGRPQEGMLASDGLHLSGGMSSINAEEFFKIVSKWDLPLPNYAPTNNADQFSSLTYPVGCINTNPMLVQGAGGTIGANAAGVCPEGYTLSTNAAGLTVTGSFVTTTFKGEVRKAFRIVATGTPAALNNNYVSLTQSGLFGKLAVGDTCFAGMEMALSDGHSNFGTPGIQINLGTPRIWGGVSQGNARGYPSQAIQRMEMTPLTPQYPVPAGTSSALLDMRFYLSELVAGGFTIDLFSAFVRKVL